MNLRTKALMVCAFLCAPSLLTGAYAHDGYDTWKQPPRPKYGCCSNYDCHPVEARFDEQRRIYQALIDGQWRDIPPEVILDPKNPANVNPDGGYHACWDHTGKILCFREAEPKG